MDIRWASSETIDAHFVWETSTGDKTLLATTCEIQSTAHHFKVSIKRLLNVSCVDCIQCVFNRFILCVLDCVLTPDHSGLFLYIHKFTIWKKMERNGPGIREHIQNKNVSLSKLQNLFENLKEMNQSSSISHSIPSGIKTTRVTGCSEWDVFCISAALLWQDDAQPRSEMSCDSFPPNEFATHTVFLRFLTDLVSERGQSYSVHLVCLTNYLDKSAGGKEDKLWERRSDAVTHRARERVTLRFDANSQTHASLIACECHSFTKPDTVWTSKSKCQPFKVHFLSLQKANVKSLNCKKNMNTRIDCFSNKSGYCSY